MTLTANEIRNKFLNFFQSKGHTIVPSAPIVLKNDPTLLFTNAGMNQFKDYFLGNATPPYARAADTQKCLRVSGKHNDLEEVGVDTYHHTMFEMLGNWSFGDYFKKEAIAWSWELLTEVYKLPKDRLYVTIFEGDEKENLPKDTEAYEEWKNWIAEDRILLGNKKDNFWEMGDTGPCGPCTEIHVDCRTDEERNEIPGDQLINKDHPQVIEIWNNVFMQFNRLKDGRLELLPAKHVDTGMGFERLVRVIQNKSSNYDTDIFKPTIDLVAQITNKQYDASATPSSGTQWGEAVAFRVIADHIRAICFTIADGQLPASNGAGYVIRRILRRAVRYYYTNLDYKQPLLFQLVPHIAEQFKDVFTELSQQLDFVKRVILEEEEAFLRTLGKGLKRLEDALTSSQNNTLDGATAFELYDTYGFPLDLTKLISQEHSIIVDEKGFDQEMANQKSRSKAATEVDRGDWVVLKDNHVTFVGYNQYTTNTYVTKYRSIKGKGKEQIQIVLAETPFYAESGGQVGDTGTLQFGDEVLIVRDTKKENDLIINFVDQLPNDITLPVIASIDIKKRINTAANHSATHLLHAALRQVLGTHVVQKGSLVNDEYLRFDFAHFAKLTDEEINEVQKIINENIRKNIPVVIKEMSKDEAIALGAMALFGEKYGDLVRVVIIDPNYSIELCGGTHVGHTGEIGFAIISSESAVASGVRRIEMLSGAQAASYTFNKLNEHKEASEILKSKDLIKSIDKLISDKQTLEKSLATLEEKQIASLAKELVLKVQNVGEIQFVGEHLSNNNMDALKKAANIIVNNLSNAVVVLTAEHQGKAQVAIAISESLANNGKIEANNLIKQHVAPLIKGGGGGNKTLASAGGQNIDQLQQVLTAIKNLLA